MTKKKLNEFKNIAKFMGGVSLWDSNVYRMPFEISDGKLLNIGSSTCHLDVSQAKYDISFDWLMPVIKKIQESGVIAITFNDFSRINFLMKYMKVINQSDWWDIKKCYKLVIEYIDWFLINGYDKKLKTK